MPNQPLDNFEEMLAWNGDQFTKGGKPVPAAKTAALIEGARALALNQFFTLLMDSIRREGYRRFEIATDWETAQFGKALLYLHDVLSSKVANASKLPLPRTRPIEHESEPEAAP